MTYAWYYSGDSLKTNQIIAMSAELQRRDFIKKGFAIGAAFSLVDLGGLFAQEEPLQNDAAGNKKNSGGKPDLVAVRGKDRVKMLDAALAALGGIAAFVKPGQTVVLKPNAAWDKPPEMSANIHPDIMGRMVELCMQAGAKEVNVFDNPCSTWQNAYKNSGIEDAVKKAGGKMLNGKDESMYIERSMPKADKLKNAKVHRLIVESDVYINMPVLKHHGGAVMTGCLKNVMGLVWDRRFFHNNNLQQCICDGILIRKPDLNIMDAYAPMARNGPQGKSKDDLLHNVNALLVSPDAVACDAAGAIILGHQEDSIEHVRLAAAAGYGVCKMADLNIKRIKLD